MDAQEKRAANSTATLQESLAHLSLVAGFSRHKRKAWNDTRLEATGILAPVFHNCDANIIVTLGWNAYPRRRTSYSLCL